MFDIFSVSMTNFRSYRGEHTFRLPTKPGLYCLTGDNQANPRLESNGTGKSTLLDAIYWCLYGKTTRGLKSSDVITWNEKSCVVTVDLKVGDQEATITRRQSPNGLEITYGDKGHDCSQDEIQKYLRLAPDAFTYAVMLPQYGDAFFDLSPSDKLTLFSQVMELEFWLEKSKTANDLAAELLADKYKAEIMLGGARGQMLQADDSIKQLSKLDIKFSQEQDTLINKLERELQDHGRNEKALNTQLRTAKEALLGAEGRLIGATKRVKAAVEKRDRAENLLSKLETRAALDAKELSTVTVQWAKLDQLDPICPTCLQQVDERHLKREVGHLKSKVAAAKAAVQVTKGAIAGCEGDLKSHTAELTKAEGALNAIDQNRRDFEREVSNLETKQSVHKSLEGSLRASIDLEMKRRSPYTQQITNAQQLVRKLGEKLTKLKRDIAVLNEDHAAVSYWVNGFKRIRLYLIEETLRQLELEINNNLGSLGLVDWRIELDVERENKSGGVTKGFVVLVRAPGHAEPVRFEAWSGGETQRLCLAGDLGLANLIMHRAGLSSTVEFYDEPTKHLSQAGLLDVAETLYQRAEDTKKRIFLVDHNNLDFGDFAGRIVAVKDKDGSRLDVQW